jgi:hypothetical protein
MQEMRSSQKGNLDKETVRNFIIYNVKHSTHEVSPVFYYAANNEDVWGSKSTVLVIPNPCTKWRGVVSFTLRPLKP